MHSQKNLASLDRFHGHLKYCVTIATKSNLIEVLVQNFTSKKNWKRGNCQNRKIGASNHTRMGLEVSRFVKLCLELLARKIRLQASKEVNLPPAPVNIFVIHHMILSDASII